jgi:hypothetical protein
MIANMPDDATLSFEMLSGCCGDTEFMDLIDVDVMEPAKDWSGALRFQFAQLPGYRSCIQAGGTIRSDKEYWEKHGKKTTP